MCYNCATLLSITVHLCPHKLSIISPWVYRQKKTPLRNIRIIWNNMSANTLWFFELIDEQQLISSDANIKPIDLL